MRLLFIDTKPNNPNRYICRAVYDALCRHPAWHEVVWAEYSNALALAHRQPFDALLAFDGEEADNPVIHRLCARIPRRAIWFTEDPYEFHRNQHVAQHFDLILTNDATTAARYGDQALHMPLAADRDRHFLPITEQAPLYDVFFAGSAWPNRLDFLHRLRQARPHLRLKTILVSNPALAPHIEPWQDAFTYSRGVSIRDFCRLANRSLLTLALPRRFSTDAANPDAASDTPGPRLFEVAAAGGCQLVDAGTTPMAASLFDPASQFLSFTQFDDCLARIDEALADPVRIRAMAAAAQAVTRERHLYDHRIDQLSAKLAALPARPQPVELERQPKVLFVAHNIVEHGHFGGSELYLAEARRHLGRVDAWVLVSDHRDDPATSYLLYDPTGTVVEQFAVGDAVDTGQLLHAELEDFFQSLLERYGFDLVHFNHIMRFPFSLPLLAKALGVLSVYSLHDYYPLCENFNLIGPEARYCAIPDRPAASCDGCLARTRGIQAGSQAKRLSFLRRAFDGLDLVLAGSQASADILLAQFPHLANRIALLPPPMIGIGQRGRAIGSDAALHVALLGNFTRIKGGDTALAVFHRSVGQGLVFHLFGRVDGDYQQALEDLPPGLVINHGPYAGGQIPAAFGDCDIALFLSPWPETYCISLSEAQAFGLVPVVTALGGQGERVRHDIDGLQVPVGDVEATLAALTKLQDRATLARFATALPSEPGIDGVTFAARLDNLYHGLLGEHAGWPTRPQPSRRFGLDELGIVLTQSRWAPPPATGVAPVVIGLRDKLGFLRRKFTATLHNQGLGYTLRRSVAWALFWAKRRLLRMA